MLGLDAGRANRQNAENVTERESGRKRKEESPYNPKQKNP
jgi:hypothetical protein